MKASRERLLWLVGTFLESKTSKKVLMFRQCESLGDNAGSLVGWTDSKLTVKGRKQAHSLYAGLYQHINKFDGIYSSDLSRSLDTANIALSFKKTKEIIVDPRLRERNFGVQEGVHYDGLSEKEKKLYEDFTHKPEGGETWEDVKLRSQSFFSDLKSPGNYLVFTHGGLICVNTFSLGLPDVISCGSCVALELDDNSKPSKLLFAWDMEEDASME